MTEREALRRIAGFTLSQFMGPHDMALECVNVARDAFAQPEQEPVAIKWTLDGDKTCGYNNWLGKTPFGRILITWKGWKKYHNACVDEFPGDFAAYGSPDEVKEMCEAEFAKRIGYTTPQPAVPERKPLSDEEIDFLWRKATMKPGLTLPMVRGFARAIEAAHGIKE